MARAKLLFQAITQNTHKDVVNEALQHPELEGAIVSAAFANVAGVKLLQENMANISDSLDVFIGIRNEITSFQAFEALLETGANVYAVDTGSRNLVYHPKIYGAWNAESGTLTIGSANLTFSGLTNNIEASAVLNLDLSDDQDQSFLNDFRDSFANMLVDHPDHVFRINDVDMLRILLEEGRLSDEARRKIPSGATKSATTERDPLKTINTFKIKRGSYSLALSPQPVPITAAAPGVPAATMPGYDVVWKSKPLLERDLNIPKRATTHKTGDMNWKKGNLTDIDQRHYFRDVVFGELNWEADAQTPTAHLERSFANFTLIIKGIQSDPYTLQLTHDTKTDTSAYIRKNCMTKVRWGEAKSIISRPDLLGRTLTLLKNTDNPPKYIIEID